MDDYTMQQLVLHSPFDIQVHKATFKNYLEVIILESGTVEYAVPSHQEKMIQLGMKKTGLSREEFYNRCPKEYWFDVIAWLSKETRAIAVWDFKFEGWANPAQVEKLEELRAAGLYHGSTENQAIYC